MLGFYKNIKTQFFGFIDELLKFFIEKKIVKDLGFFFFFIIINLNIVFDLFNFQVWLFLLC